MDQAVVWKIKTEKASLDELLQWARREGKVDHLLLAMRLEPTGNRWRYANQQAGDRLKLLFGPFIRKSFYASAWPGTEVMGVPGEVTALQFNQKVQYTILKTQPNLNKWVHSSVLSLPEDLCLFRSGASWPSLITVTHEKQAWLIAPERPSLPGISESDLQPNQFVYEDEYFCRRYLGRSSQRK